MAKAQFNDTDIAAAVNAFAATIAPREVPAVGKNSSVTVYGENPNPYKPPKVELKDEPDEKIDANDIGTTLSGIE